MQEIGLWTNFKYTINVANNNMGGLLPVEVFTGLSSSIISGLTLTNNEFSGSIPTQIGMWTRLTGWLVLQNNDFTGTLPTVRHSFFIMSDAIACAASSLTDRPTDRPHMHRNWGSFHS